MKYAIVLVLAALAVSGCDEERYQAAERAEWNRTIRQHQGACRLQLGLVKSRADSLALLTASKPVGTFDSHTIGWSCAEWLSLDTLSHR